MRGLYKTIVCAIAVVAGFGAAVWAAGVALAEAGSFSPPYEQRREIPRSQSQLTLSYAALVKSAAPAVVNIYTRKVVRQRLFAPFMDDPFFQQFFGGRLSGGLSRERVERSLGSGVIIRPDGLIVTSNHVISGADEVTVVLSDKREFPAKILTADERSDLAVLRIDKGGHSLPYVELRDSDDIEVGDIVLAIGNPFGVGQTVTSGIISALARTSTDINDLNYFIQTDAAINPGNSGGALVAMDGKLVGINAAIFSKSGGNMGIGFAVPSNMVRTIVAATDKGRKDVQRPWLGVKGQEVTSDMAASLGMDRPAGMLVNGIHPASPAKEAGLKIGDVVVAVNGKGVDDPAGFAYRVATLPIGGTVDVETLRNGQKLRVAMRLEPPPEKPSRDATVVKGRNPLAGTTLVNLSPAVAEEIGLRDIEAETGVVVAEVTENSAASELGLRPSDMVLAVNGVETASVREAVKALSAAERGWRISIRRGGNVFNLMVRN